MKLKKITAVLLAFSMLCTIIPALAQETTAEKSTPLSSEEFYMLKEMKLLGEEILSMNEEDFITRAQFAGNLFNISGYVKIQHETRDIPFIDVNKNTPYFDEIVTLYELNMINGTSVNTFSPDDNITLIQAIKLIVDVLGYKSFTKAKFGDYPQSYIGAASYLKLNSGISLGDVNAPLTAKVMVELFYNAGRTNVLEFEGITHKGNLSYSGKNDVELFNLSDIYYGEGIMQSNGIVSLMSDSNTEGVTIISGVEYKAPEMDVMKLLGCSIKFFYYDDGSTKRLLWAGEDERKNNYLSIKSRELVTDSSLFDLKTIVYLDNNKTKEARIDKYADVVYNNMLYNGYTLDMLKIDAGEIRLIDNNNDKVYDTVIIEAYENLFVKAVIQTGEYIVDKYNNSLFLDEYDYVKIYKDGKEARFDEIAVNTVLSYMESPDKKYLYLYINTTGWQEKLEAIGEENGEEVYCFPSGEYMLSKLYKKNVEIGNYKKTELLPGKIYKYYIDKAGDIAEIEEPSGELQYALFIRMAEPDTPFNSDKKIQIRLLMADGVFVTATTAAKLTIDGEKDRKGIELLTDRRLVRNSGKFIEQVVRVAFDKEGDIKEFDISEENYESEYGYDNTRFTVDYLNSSAYYRDDGCTMFDKKYTLYLRTAKFFINLDQTNEELRYVIGWFPGEGTYNVKLYDLDETFAIGAMIMTLSSSISKTGAVLIDEVRYVKNADGDFYKEIRGYENAYAISYIEESEGNIPDGLKRGDLVRLDLDPKTRTKVIACEKLCSLRERPEPYLNGGDIGGDTFIFGYLYSHSTKNVVTLTPEENIPQYGKLISTSTRNQYYIPMMIYDARTDTITRGDITNLYQVNSPDADGYLDINSNSTMVHMRRYYDYMDDIIVAYY